MDKIDEIVKREVAKSLYALFPDKIISVTLVQVSKDLSFAKVWITALDDLDNVVQLCQNHSPEISHDIAGRLTTKRSPKLVFVADRSAEKVDRIEELLREINNDEKKP